MSAPPTSVPNGKLAASAESPSVGAILAELEIVASRTDRTSERCGLLFERLRKVQDSPRLPALLAGLEVHQRRGGPVGARLLAAYLDMATRSERLLPRLNTFTSSRRFLLRLNGDQRAPNAFARDWVERLAAASEDLADLREPGDEVGARPGSEYPWPQVRRWLDASLAELQDAPNGASGTARRVCDWLRLELDALEERASHLAGTVNPFRVATVQRMLPLLNELDGVIRDGRRWLTQLAEGDFEDALRRPTSRALERMEEGEFRALMRAIEAAGARRLADLLLRRLETARPAAELADDILRLQLLGQVLARRGGPQRWPDPLSAAETAVRCGTGQGLRVELDPELQEALRGLLAEAGAVDPRLEGLRCDEAAGWLVLPRRPAVGTRDDWPHGLPVVRDGRIDDAPLPAPAEQAAAAADAVGEGGAAATRRLVVGSLQTMSILLALLRNPKVTSIPGLVAEVATRTRNPQVIATIATDRALYTGFANRDVPLACLWNPSNVSVKVLRKFIHVKYVSKLDLVRLSQDRAGVRRELRHEIDRYLETLA